MLDLKISHHVNPIDKDLHQRNLFKSLLQILKTVYPIYKFYKEFGKT